MTDRKKWQRVKDVVDSALKLEARTWPSWLAERCGDDVDVFLDATSLLAASRKVSKDFIEGSAVEYLEPMQARRHAIER